MFNRTVGVALIVLLTISAQPVAAHADTCGLASWYDEGSHTANGERYNPDGLTAAHRSLPFGTHLRVVSQRTHKEVNVIISDRGPALWTGKSIDLSRGAARVLGILQRGVERVCYIITSIDAPSHSSHKYHRRAKHSYKD